ncbi:MAG: hypothetical protein ACRECT_08800 [Thermoplasmata archaeon]
MGNLVPGSSSLSAPGAELALDLSDESRYLIRRRRPTTTFGVVVGAVFIVIGAFELAVNLSGRALANSIVASLLVALGASLIVLSLRSGLINPVTFLRADAVGVRFSRRWRGAIVRGWADPELGFDVEDLGADAGATPPERTHLFFSSGGVVYGTLGRGQIGPMLDVMKAHGMSVRISTQKIRVGRTDRRIRRIRISTPTEPSTIVPGEDLGAPRDPPLELAR